VGVGERDIDHSPQSSFEVKEQVVIPLLPLRAFMLEIKILLLLLGLIPYTSIPRHVLPQFGAGGKLGKGE